MTKKKKRMTAAELLSELKVDEEFQRRQESKNKQRLEREQELTASMRPYISQLQQLGLRGDSLESMVELNCPLQSDAIQVLLTSMEELKEPRLLESVARALAASATDYDGRPLARAFDAARDPALRWAIVNTISLTHPHSISTWLASLRKSAYWDKVIRSLKITEK